MIEKSIENIQLPTSVAAAISAGRPELLAVTIKQIEEGKLEQQDYISFVELIGYFLREYLKRDRLITQLNDLVYSYDLLLVHTRREVNALFQKADKERNSARSAYIKLIKTNSELDKGA